MNPRAVDFGIQLMTADAFEDLVYALVLVDEPTARQLKPPDAGRDTVVPALGGRRERAWQAKHHTSGIDWSDCQRSLDTAVTERNPEEVTFVFPVNMTKGKEPGLTELRKRYPEEKVRLPEPWTLGTLRQKLLANPEIRRAHIDAVIGLDHAFARELFERGADVKQRWSEQTDAAMRGPLKVFGLEQAARDAEEAAGQDDWRDASARYEELAREVADRMPAVADVLLLRAAQCAMEASDRQRAGDLHLQVSRSAAGRGDSAAEYAAFRASWELPEEQRWRSFAAMARASWPERPDDSTEVLRQAFERCRADGDQEGMAEWGDACCEAMAAQGDWQGVRTVAEAAANALGPVTEPGARLEIELDLLDARAAYGEEVDADFRELLLKPLSHDDRIAGRLRARWACVLVRSGRRADASLRFEEARSAWAGAAGAEDELAEVALSGDAASQLSGEGPELDQTARIAIADLRGREMTPAVMADRKETEGLRSWLWNRGYEARRSLTIAWSIHRRSGHLGGSMRLSQSLFALFERAGEWTEMLTWAIRVGNGLKTREAAKHLTWSEVRNRIQLAGPLWEQIASCEAIAEQGAEASDDEVEVLIDPLLELAAEEHDDEGLRMRPGPAARQALSAVLCGVDAQHFDQALERVRHEVRHTPFPPRDSTQALLLATDAGLCDESELIAEIFCANDRAHVPGFPAAVELVTRSGPARAAVTERAECHFVALIFAAHLRLPDTSPTLARRAADVVARAIDGSLAPDEILRGDDRGLLARWAAAEHQDQVVRWLVEDLANSDDIDIHRYEAGEGLADLADALPPKLASEILAMLRAAAARINEPSSVTEMHSHPNPHFARVKIDAPHASGYIRAVALRAATELAARCDQLADVAADVTSALSDPDPVVRAAAVAMAHRHPVLAQVDFDALLRDQNREIRGVALAACAERGDCSVDALVALAAPDQPLAIRGRVLQIARGYVSRYGQPLRLLAEDPHTYVRAAARHALSQR